MSVETQLEACTGQGGNCAAIELLHPDSLGNELVIIGGEPLSKRHIWWNFVSSRRQRIEQAVSLFYIARIAWCRVVPCRASY